MKQFADICKQRQTQFRQQSATLSERARTPVDDLGKRHGYLLALGCEDETLYAPLREMDGAISFFKSRQIKWWRSGSSGDDCSKAGPTRNLLSSQVLCVNFLLPLARDPIALQAVLEAIDPGITGVVPIGDGVRSSLVEFEWIGIDGSLEGGLTRGANVTSVDSLIVGLSSAEPRAYLFEWKYTESYRPDISLLKGASGDKRRGRYQELFLAKDSSFRPDVPIEDLFYEPFYQLTRLRLLADQIVRDKTFGSKKATVVVVCPQENMAFRGRITSPGLREKSVNLKDKDVESVFKSVLKDPEGFHMVAPSELLDAVRKKTSNQLRPWIDYLSDRYQW